MTNKLLNGLKEAGIIVGITYIGLLGINDLTCNNTKYRGNSIFISRPDGAFNHTELHIYRHEDYRSDEITQYKFLGTSKFISDDANGKTDGLVDRIYMIRLFPLNSLNLVLERDKDSIQYQKEFNDADKLLKETKERFKDYY